MPNDHDQQQRATGSGEACGRCGATVAGGLDVCPECGALLAAYRTPVGLTDAPPDSPIVDAPVAPDVIPGESPPQEAIARLDVVPSSVSQSESIPTPESMPLPGLDEARAALLSTLLVPGHRLVEEIETKVRRDAQPHEIAVHPVSLKSVVPTSRSEDRPPIQRADTRPSAPPQPLPKKPGFVSIGSIEPVILLGCTIFAIAVFVGFCSSLGYFRRASSLALVLGTFGVVTIIFAMLIALVRKDQNRR